MLKVIFWNAESIKVCIYPSGSWGRNLWGFGWGACGEKTERLRGECGRPSGSSLPSPSRGVFVAGSPHPSCPVLPTPPAARMSPRGRCRSRTASAVAGDRFKRDGDSPKGRICGGELGRNHIGRDSVWLREWGYPWGWSSRAGRAGLVEGGTVRVTGSWRGSCASTLRARRASRIAFGPLPGRCAARFPPATLLVKRKGCPVRGSLGVFIVQLLISVLEGLRVGVSYEKPESVEFVEVEVVGSEAV